MTATKKKSKSKNYFTQETEDAIIAYNSTADPEKKKELFEKHIHYPFYKLCENIIHTFKLRYTDTETIEDLKHKIISILLEEKIHKFDPSVGAKAYSYFGTIVKRWLINYNNKNYKEIKNKGTWEEFNDTGIPPETYVEDGSITLSEFFDEFVEYVYENFEEMFPKEQDREIADAILTIFTNRKDLEIFKKKAIYIYVKEITDCKTVHLTKVIKVLKREFYNQLREKDKVGLLVDL